MSWTRCLVISSHPEPCIRYISYWQSTSYQLFFVLLRNMQYQAHAQISYLGYIRQYSQTEIRWKIISALEEASTGWRHSWISWFRSIATIFATTYVYKAALINPPLTAFQAWVTKVLEIESTLWDNATYIVFVIENPDMKILFNRTHTKIYIVL